jgi:hypothetical protein
MELLRATGDLLPARHGWDDLPDPLPLEPGQEPASRVLERLRRDER